MLEASFLKFPLHIVIVLWLLNKVSKKRFTIADPVMQLLHQLSVIRSISIMFPENKYLSPIIEDYCHKLEAECDRLSALNVAVVGFIPKGE